MSGFVCRIFFHGRISNRSSILEMLFAVTTGNPYLVFKYLVDMALANWLLSYHKRMAIIISESDLARVRERHRDKGIVFCSGSFDLTHAGHVLFFEDCKKHGDILVVTVGADAAIKKNKGSGRPIINEHARLKIISSLAPVDYCLLENVSYRNPLDHIAATLQQLHPDVYVVNEDAFDIYSRQEIAKKHNAKLIILKRWTPPEFEQISTTNIIQKIKQLS